MARPERNPPRREPTARDRAVRALHAAFEQARQQRGLSLEDSADLLDKILNAVFAADAEPVQPAALVAGGAAEPGDHTA